MLINKNMSKIWKHWCRLCAGEEDIKVIEHKGQQCSLYPFISRYLSVQMNNDDYPNSICSSCFNILQEFNFFAIKCEKVQVLFNTIIREKKDHCEDNLKVMRDNYLISISCDEKPTLLADFETEDKETRKHKNKTNKNKSIKSENVTKSDPVKYELEYENIESYFDTNHLDNDENFNVRNNTDYILIKEEDWQHYDDSSLCKTEFPQCRQDVNINKRQKRSGIRIKNKQRLKLKKSRKSINLNIKSGFSEGKTKKCKEKNPYVIEKDALICNICGEAFPIHNALVRHMPIHFPNYICDICAKVFDSKSKLTKHLSIHQAKQYKCHICGKLYKGNDSLRTHIQRHSKHHFYKCLHCPQRFQTYFARLKHLIQVHGEEPKEYKCKQCTKVFLQCAALTRHVKRIHLQEKPHVCSTCGNGFFTKSELSNHMRKHTGVRSFKCTVCLKSFGRKYTLNEHMKIHNNDKRFICTFCGRAFTQKCTLKGHLKTHDKSGGHGEFLAKDVENHMEGILS